LSRNRLTGNVRAVAANADKRAQCGQASVELVAVVPFVLLIGAVVWQLTLAGHTAWLTANAARAAARADTVGRDATAAARSALPRSIAEELEVRRLREGGIRVSVRIPLLLRRWRGPVRVAATSSLGRER
jgi:hypothetical protein